MHLTYLLIIYSLFLFISLTTQDASVISFQPSSISLTIGENKSVTVRLLKSDITFPISLVFLYDGKLDNTQGYIYSVPNITFTNHTTDDQRQPIIISGRHQGHLVLAANSSQINISSLVDFLLIDVARSNVLNIFIQIVGWIYFLAWSISFYPQIILNFRRRSVIGLNFDFLALNILGHSCYSVFNVVLYTSSKVQQEYYAKHPHGVLPVLLNDPNIGLDRARLRTVPDSSTSHPLNNVFTPFLPKPSVLASSTSTPPSTLANPLPNQSHTLPSVLLPSSTTNTSITLFGKRKLADSFLDDDDNNSLMMDDGPALSINKISKTNVLKRPRILDMNKVRSVVLGGGSDNSIGTGNNEIITKEENFSDTFVVKSTSDNLSGWKKFATYDAYLASKRQQIENIKISDDVDDNNTIDKQINLNEKKFEQERAFRLPKLTHDDYYTRPTIDELRHYFNEKGQCCVKEFTVGREHYGSVKFQGSKINLAGLDLNQLIEIGRRQITVYPDDNNKPAEGEELNCQAIISLIGVYPIDRSISNSGEEVTDPDRLIEMNYEDYLRSMTVKFHGKFLDYDVYTGTWIFQVEHF
ncbi:unnamed protein product [Rotaria sp. Silwood1]|nr:unnamed protein product [Rotaria sp. Silwood1]